MVLVNPIATKSTALLWVAVLKVLDVASTLAGHYTVPGFRELNVLVNTLQPYIGFEAALVLTAPLALGIVYLWHEQYPVLSEAMIVLLPVAVIGNTLIVVAPQLWLTFMAGAVVMVLGYVAVGAYQHHKQAETWKERLFGVPDPVLWTPEGGTADN